MITEKFIKKIRVYFSELGIDAKNGISYDEFEEKCIATFNKCKESEDGYCTYDYYKYCSKKWRKIKKLFSKYLYRWQIYNFEKPRKINTDNDSNCIYSISNAFSKKKKPFLTMLNENKVEKYLFKHKNKRYTLEDDNEYYLQYSLSDIHTINLCDKNNKILCNIDVFNEGVFKKLKDNTTNIEILDFDTEETGVFYGVFKKSYINSLKNLDKINLKNMIADFKIQIFDFKRGLVAIKANMYEGSKDLDDSDFDQMALIAFAIFLNLKYIATNKRLFKA